MVHIDGSQGEGGGQVLRTALALSVVTGLPLRVENIRAGRKKPGLMAQHLKAVEAAAMISGAVVEGAAPGAKTLFFKPRGLFPGNYRFDIGTAGSTSLVFQTILVPLSFAEAPSNVMITGGTHVSWSPSFHFLQGHFSPFLKRIGFNFDLVLAGAGYYPQGGGCVKATINPARNIAPLELVGRGKLLRISGLSGATNLPGHIIQRQASQVRNRLAAAGYEKVDLEESPIAGKGKGTFVHLLAEFEHAQCCCDALGARGKPAERVADEAVEQLLAFLGSDGAIDEHLADQLILPLSFASGISRLRTSRITPHLQTNAEVVGRFLPVEVHIKGDLGEAGEMKIKRKEFNSQVPV